MEINIKEFLQALSSVEKRYGRSIVDIRRQIDVWEEILSGQEILLSPSVFSPVDGRCISASFVALPVGCEFYCVFDVMKQISRFMRYNLSIGLDLSSARFSRSQWLSFLMLLKATVLDSGRVWLTISLESISTIDFLYAAQNQEMYFCGLNLIVSAKFLDSLRTNGQIEIVNGDITGLEKVDANHIAELIESIRRQGAKIRFVFRESISWNDIPALGSRIVLLDSGVSLIPGEAVPVCGLNLIKMVRRSSSTWELDWERLADRIHNAVRLLDDLVDLNDFPLREVYETTRRTRRVALHLVGWSQMLCRLGLPYDSEAAVELANKLAKFVKEQTNLASWTLARERGVFPSYRASELEKQGIKRRNASVLTGMSNIAPMESLREEEVFSLFDEISRQRGFYSEELLRYIEKNSSLRDLEYLPEDIKRIFAVKQDIDFSWQIKMQAAFQESCDGFVDLEASITEKTALSALLWKANLFGASGLTLPEYKPVASTESQEIVASPEKVVAFGTKERLELIESRPEVLFGSTVKVETACGPLLVTINQDDHGRLREILLRLDKASGCVGAHLEAISKLLSLLVASGMDLSYIIKALSQINCSAIAWNKGKRVFSCADAIAQVLAARLESAKSSSSRIELEGLDSDLLHLN